ncbi:MAG: hypothetical protein FJ117_18970 [Deltaproteobacteria bacterium]|nr:hypothetical protein [Deltaproteobacteria bacterium]
MYRKVVSIITLTITTLLSFIICIPSMNALEVEMHGQMNERISFSNFNAFSLSQYLINQLGIRGGVNELFDNKAVFRWMRDGGRYEDEPPLMVPYLRSVNHYHNPLTEQGFSGYFFGTFLSGESSVIWAQRSVGAQSPGGYYSWNDVRHYYYRALTALTKTDRGKNFAETFRGLGQLLHLVQDVSVPAHTRNDAHIIGYEKWIQKNINISTINPVFFTDSILNRLTAGLPIANIFDTNQYLGHNPEVTVGNNIGLAEYTNANFFSEDTINSQNFPYPRIDAGTPIIGRHYTNPFETYTRLYYLKNCCGETNSNQGYLLSAVDYLDYWKAKNPALSYLLPKIPVLDENVYADYAKFLVPRAVGYSAGLLKYFFRGQLQVACLPVFYNNSISQINVTVKNVTPTHETMRNGYLVLMYRYTPTGAPADGSGDILGYATNAVPVSELLLGDNIEASFVIYPNVIPVESYSSLKFTIVFKGALGNEEGAVIGKYFTPGEIKFNEEWDKGLTDNNAWAHTGHNLMNQNPDNGSTSNAIVNGLLIKGNTRNAGFRSARVNETFVSIYHPSYKDKLPILITPNTYIQFKIDAMSISSVPPADPGTTTHWQGLWLHFNNGLVIQLSLDGQFVYWNPTTAYYTFAPGFIIVDNIYKMFQNYDITIPEHLNLLAIDFVQQLTDLQDPSIIEHRQHMEVDFIRIVEGKVQ